jgi:hypothetical protein
MLLKVRKFALVALLGMGSLPAFAQRCAMCNAAAKATPKEGQQALNRAILVMLVPPISVMVVGVGFVFDTANGAIRNESGNKFPAGSYTPLNAELGHGGCHCR